MNVSATSQIYFNVLVPAIEAIAKNKTKETNVVVGMG